MDNNARDFTSKLLNLSVVMHLWQNYPAFSKCYQLLYHSEILLQIRGEKKEEKLFQLELTFCLTNQYKNRMESQFGAFDLIILKCFLIGISWIEGNAEELPIDTASVDAYTIAFGIRNVTRIHKVTINSVLFLLFLDYK